MESIRTSRAYIDFVVYMHEQSSRPNGEYQLDEAIDTLAVAYKNATIAVTDFSALLSEVGIEVAEDDNAYKARAIVGRWVTKAGSMEEVAATLELTMAILCAGDLDWSRKCSEMIYEKCLGAPKDTPNISIACAIAYFWLYTCTVGASIKDSGPENPKMPSHIMGQCIFLERLKSVGCNNEAMTIINTLSSLCINDLIRYNTNMPHPASMMFYDLCFGLLAGRPVYIKNKILDRLSKTDAWNALSFFLNAIRAK